MHCVTRISLSHHEDHKKMELAWNALAIQNFFRKIKIFLLQPHDSNQMWVFICEGETGNKFNSRISFIFFSVSTQEKKEKECQFPNLSSVRNFLDCFSFLHIGRILRRLQNLGEEKSHCRLVALNKFQWHSERRFGAAVNFVGNLLPHYLSTNWVTYQHCPCRANWTGDW